MNAVERRDAKILKPDGDALVGGEHELLDEPIGPGALGARDAAHLAVLVELDDRLGQVEIDRAALFAALVHEDGELLHPFEFRNQRRIASACFRVALKNRVHLGVGHARGRADDPFDDFEALDVAGGVELHDATEHEAVFIGTKAADVGRKLLGQHGDGAIGKINAGAAEAGFEIECRAGKDVLGYVGDVNLKLVARRRRARGRGRRRQSRARFRHRW